MAVQKIDGYQAADLIAQGAVVFDLREPADFATGHIEGAVNVPFDGRFGDVVAQAAPDRSAPVIACCYVGGRSAMAARLLDQGGYERVYDMGGMGGWPFDVVQ